MFLIIGLGNPGKKYENNRHNIGSRIIDELEFLNLPNVILAKPKTFMNDSGRAAKLLTKNYKLNPNSLIVIHDDLDIPLGEFKIQKNRGSAGHKGVQSVIDSLETKNFARVRIGICPAKGKPKDVEKFVLQNFKKSEEKILKEVIKKVITEIKNRGDELNI